MVDQTTVAKNDGMGSVDKKVMDNPKADDEKAEEESTIDANRKTNEGNNEKGGIVSAGGENKESGNKDDKGGRKKNRELVIPDEPVKRYPRPSQVGLRKSIDEKNAIIKAAVARLDSTKTFYGQRSKIREAGRDEFQSAKKLQTSINDELRAKFEKRKSLSTQIAKLRDSDGGKGTKDDRGDLPPALKGCKTAEHVDAKIRELEYQHSTASLSIAAEKKLIADISYLKHKGRQFIIDREKNITAEKMAKEQRIAKRKELEEIRRSEDKEIDELKSQLEKQRLVVDGILQKQEKDIEALASKFSDIDRDAERRKIGEARKEIKRLRETYTTELDKWHMNERIYREQMRIAKRKKWEAAQAEREARRLAYEAEMAKYPKPHPYQNEKDMCTNLIAYLKSLIGIEQEKDTKILAPEKSSMPSLAKSLPTREISRTGEMGKVIGKSADAVKDSNQTFGGFVKKSGKKGRKKSRRLEDTDRSTPSPAICTIFSDKGEVALPPHSMERFSAFTRLSIKPPLKRSEVPDAIEALKSKLIYFDSAPPPEEVKKADEEEKQQSASKDDKDRVVQDASSLSGSDYPLMNGGNVRKAEVATGWGVGDGASGDVKASKSGTHAKRPSFADIMAGKAKAPVPTSAVAPVPTSTETETTDAEAKTVQEVRVSSDPLTNPAASSVLTAGPTAAAPPAASTPAAVAQK